MNRVELLAPVGSYEAMVAAVQNGADAIYLGGKSFGARQYANNFDEKELIESVEYCHIRGVKVYVTVNTLVANDEFDDLKRFINFLYNIDVDAVIVQDLGVLKYIRESYPDFEVHSSTQMTIHNLEGIRFLEGLGIKRTVLAREMSIDEIRCIKENTKMELEVFIHGALCICYSGQCLMSSMIGGRSGNRGRCAQPCRLPYKLVDLKSKGEIKCGQGEYLLSPRDLNTIENLDKILELGVESLKIEGRMKRPEYVAVVVDAYRRAIDTYQRTGKIQVGEDIRRDLLQIFNRKFTGGYLFGETGRKLMGFEKPGNRGIEVGKVLYYNKKSKRLKIKLIGSLNQGDGIKIKGDNGREHGTQVSKLYVGNKLVQNGIEGQVVEINFNGYVGRGDVVYKTSDTLLLERAQNSYRDEKKRIPIYGAIKIRQGEELEVYIWDNNGHHVSCRGEKKIEKALNRPLTEDRVRKQMEKLGDTPYRFEKLEVDIERGVSVSISEINGVRRKAIDKLNTMRRNLNNRKKVKLYNAQSKQNKDVEYRQREKKVRLSGYVNNIEQLKAALDGDIDIIYYSNLKDIEKAYMLAEEQNKLLIPALGRITGDKELKQIKNNIDKLGKSGYILTANHGQLNMLKGCGQKLYTDFSFNIFNNLAAKQLSDLGVKSITLSPELTLNQIKDIALRSGTACEMIVYGHLPLMITKYCVIKNVLGGEDQKRCSLCNERKYGLKDRYGVVFPIKAESNCRIQILNSKKLFLLEYIRDIIDSGIVNIRLQFTNEDKNEIINTIKAYRKMIGLSLKGKMELPKDIKKLIKSYKNRGDYTKGHVFRGVI